MSERYRTLAHDFLRSLTDDQIAQLWEVFDESERGYFLAFCQSIAEDDVRSDPGNVQAIATSGRAMLAFRDAFIANPVERRLDILSIVQLTVLNEALFEAAHFAAN